MSNTLVRPRLPACLHAVANDKHRFRVVNAPRQFGKDYLGLSVAFDWAWRGGRVWWISVDGHAFPTVLDQRRREGGSGRA